MWIRRAHFSLLLLLLYLFSAATAPGQATREQDYLRREQGMYRVVYCPEDEGVINGFLAEIGGRIPLVQQQLGASIGDTITFVITPSENEWFRVTAGAPLWANGIAFPSRGVAILKSPRFGMPSGPLPNTAVHEFTHILLGAITRNGELPRWFDEGVSQLAAGQIEFMDHQLVARAAAARRLHSFQNLQGLMSMSASEAQTGYAESLLAAQLLQQRVGWSGISNLLHTMRSGLSFEEAFSQVFGESLVSFEQEYRSSIASSYGRSLLSDSALWGSAIFVVLAIAAGVATYLRRRRTLDHWEDEELVKESTPSAPPYQVDYSLSATRREEEQENPQAGDAEGSEPPPRNPDSSPER